MFELLLLLSLIGTGLYFNKDEVRKLESINKENIHNMNTGNIYQSNTISNLSRDHKEAVSKRHINAFNPHNRNVHPNNIKKTIKENFTENSSNSNHNNMNNMNNMNNNTSSFGDNVTNNNTSGVYSQLLGKKVLKEEFNHNNMVPFFKKSGLSLGNSDKLFQRKLETQTGNDRFYKKKKESKQLFKPTMGLTNMHGSQIDGKYALNKDRYSIGKNRTNELPFEKEYIQPFEGYNNEFLRDINELNAKSSLNSSVKHMRGESNVSYEGREGPPSSMIKTRGVEGETYKHRPDTFSLLKNRPSMPTTGAVVRGKKRPDCIIVPKTKRGAFTNLFGTAKSVHDKEQERPLIRKSRKITFKEDSNRNMSAADMWNIDKDTFDYGKNSFFLPATEGEAYTAKTQLLNVDSTFKAIIAPFTDIAKTTVKETNIHNDREGNFYGPTKLTVQPDDVLKTTIKETNIHNDREGNVYSYHNKHTSYDPNDILKTTIKETNIDNNREGNVSNVEAQGKGYLSNPQYAPPTNKETISDNDYYGTAGAYDNKTKSYAADYNMRQNVLKEPLEIGRDPTPESVKIANGSDTVNLDINKLDSDFINIREVAQTKIYPSIPYEVPCQITSDKSSLDNNKIANRIGGDLLNAFNKNPYTQPLNSYAYN